MFIQIVQKLSSRRCSLESRLKVLKEISTEMGIALLNLEEDTRVPVKVRIIEYCIELEAIICIKHNVNVLLLNDCICLMITGEIRYRTEATKAYGTSYF